MTTQEVANRLVELVRQNEITQCYQELYSADCESLETSPMDGPIHLKGMDAILEKGKKMQENTEEFYGLTCSEPLVAGKFFSCTMVLDAKWKGMERMAMEEVCVYKVEDGKIVLEQFFY